jgi:predicted transcriptional regulator
MAKEKQTAVRMDQKTYQALEKIAVKMDRSVSWLIRTAISDFIASHK